MERKRARGIEKLEAELADSSKSVVNLDMLNDDDEYHEYKEYNSSFFRGDIIRKFMAEMVRMGGVHHYLYNLDDIVADITDTNDIIQLGGSSSSSVYKPKHSVSASASPDSSFIEGTASAHSVADMPEFEMPDEVIDTKPVHTGPSHPRVARLRHKSARVNKLKHLLLTRRIQQVMKHAATLCHEILNPKYVEEKLVKAFDDLQPDIDILFYADEVFRDLSLPFIHRMPHIRGFMVVQRTGCALYPNAYRGGVMCSNKEGIGTILRGAYLYTILSHPRARRNDLIGGMSGFAKHTYKFKELKNGDMGMVMEIKYTDPLTPTYPIGLLECAGGYSNPRALCLYEKFGFRIDPTLWNTCYEDLANLPMSINMKHMRRDEIVRLSLGISRLDKSLFCGSRGDRQEVLGTLLHMKILIDHRFSTSQIIRANPKFRNIAYLMEHLQTLIDNIMTMNEEDFIMLRKEL
jgi:hypothetical protein